MSNREIILAELNRLGVECAGTLDNRIRWSVSDLATDLDSRIVERIAQLESVLRDTPLTGQMKAVIFSIVEGEEPTEEQKEIANWLVRRKNLLSE